MKAGVRIVGGLVPLVLLAAILAACEDTMDVLTPADSIFTVWASPSTVVIDPAQRGGPRDERGKVIKTTSISAQLLAQGGTPLQDHIVYFSTNAGRLSSGGSSGLRTDAHGTAVATLTLAEDDPPTIVVTAESSSLSKSVTVTKQLLNCLPLITAQAEAETVLPLAHPAANACATAALVGSLIGNTEAKTCVWTCGDGIAPTNPSENGCEVDCCYPGATNPATVDKTYEATVTITVTRTSCTATALDTVSVTVSAADDTPNP